MARPPFFIPIVVSSKEDYRKRLLAEIAKTNLEYFLNGVMGMNQFFPSEAVETVKATEEDIQETKAEYKDYLREMIRNMFKIWTTIEPEVVASIREQAKGARNDQPSEHV